MKLKQLIVLIFMLLFSGFCYAGDCIRFVSENYPDGSRFSINESFTKKWQVQNCGSTAWKNYKLVYAGSGKDKNLSTSNVDSVDIPDTKAGGSTTIKIKMTAPSTPDIYKSTWKAHNASDKAFGNPSGKITGIWAIIIADDPANPTNGKPDLSEYGKPPERGNPVTGNGRGCTVTTGNPIDTATGSQDYKLNLLSVSGLRDINFVAHYSSLVFSSGSMGTAWGHNYETALEEYEDQSVRIAWRNNREDLYDKQADGSYKSLTKEAAYNHLVKNSDGTFVLTLKNKTQYFFDTTGQLLKDTNPQGQSLIYTHNGSGLVTEVREPVSGVYLQFNYDANLHLSSVNDPLGRKVEFSYDDEGRIIAYSNALGQKMSYTLNSKGQVISAVNPESIKTFTNTFDEEDRIFYQKRTRDFSPDLFAIDYSGIKGDPVYPVGITDHLGNKQTVVYQDEYVIKEITDELGNKTQIAYDDKNNPIKITDAKQRVTEQTFDTKGNLTSVKNPLGQTVSMTYDGNDDLVSYTDAQGNITKFTYDNKHNVLSKTDAAGKTTKLTYTAEGKIATITTPAGRMTSYAYQNGRVSEITDAQAYKTYLTYDVAGRLIGIKDGDGFITTLVLDNLDRVIQAIDPLGNKTQNTYDSRGNILTTTDPNGNTTSFAYDGNTNLIKTTNALGAVTGYEYDANDRIIKITDAKGNATTLTYDAKGRVTKTTDALGNTETAEYDATDQLIKNLDPLGQETLYNYNQIDHLIKVTNALNKSAQFDYDKNSNVIAVTDPLERKTINSYDALNRLIENTDALAGKARQAYDDDSHITAMTDPNNNQTSFTLNPRGLVTSETTAAGRKLQFDYNGRGLVTKIINGRKQLKSIAYDGAGRVIKTTDPVGTTRYTYDKNGNLLKTIDAHGTITRQYDVLNRIIAYTNTAGEKIQYQYDANDNLTALIYPPEPMKSHHDHDDDSDDNEHHHHRRHHKPAPIISKQVTYSYDALNRMTKVMDWANRVTSYEYDANSRLIKTTRPNGSVETRRYNSINQLVELKDVSRHNKPIYQVNYEYDAVGNIVKEDVLPDSRIKLPESTTLSYSADNRIKRFSDKTIEFDADGNMTKAPLTDRHEHLRFNARNQLVSALKTTYRYDAEGYRTHQISHEHGIRYTVNPEAVLSQVLIEHNASKNTYYVYGLGLIGQEANKHYQSYHFDYRGSTVALTNSEGHKTERYSYTPFGDVSDHDDDHKTAFQYNGRDGVITDANGLYYMRARYYSPELHRFVSQDVLLGEVASSKTLNRYGYVEGNPIRHIDPTGFYWGESYVNALVNNKKERFLYTGEIFQLPYIQWVLSKYSKTIEKKAETYKVDPNLIRAVIKEEQSHKIPILEDTWGGEKFWTNTVGLGQMTIGKHGYTRDQLLDPINNIDAIAQELASLQSNNNKCFTIEMLATKYNCGSCNNVSSYGKRVSNFYNGNIFH